jgi:hypothetical protein
VLLTLKNTTAIDLESIDRSKRYDIQAFDSGIKKYHQFRFDETPTIQCFELSNQGNPILEQLYPVDENDDNMHTDTNSPPWS